MQCGNCGSSEHVTIGDQQYCTNCGAIVGGTSQPTPATAPVATEPTPVAVAATPAPAPTKAFSDIAGPGQVSSIVAAVPDKATMPAPRKQLSDIVGPGAVATTVAAVPPNAPTQPATSTLNLSTPSNAGYNPAGSFHAAPTPASLSLDVSKSSAAPITPVPAPTAAPAQQPTVTPVAVVASPAPAPEPTSATAEPASLIPATISKDQRASARLQRAASVPKSDLIGKFGAAQALSATTVAAAATETAPTPMAPSTLVMPTAPASTPVEPAAELPNAAATHHAAMQALLDAPDEHPALSAGIKPVGLLKSSSTAAAALAIAVMGGFIWIKNYPNMELKVAAGKAGVEASMPGYVPAGYNLSGPVSYAPGEISLNFKSNSGGGPLTITQRRTNWNSQTLLDSYVATRGNNYVAVDNQGLTVYMYNGNQASWVNHGVWYAIEGSTRLSRDQVLRIVDSL